MEMDHSTKAQPPSPAPPENSLGKNKKISKKSLANKLNYTNFQEGTISINFRHSRYDNAVSVPAKPLPCAGDTLDCVWVQPISVSTSFANFEVESFSLTDGQRNIIVEGEVIRLDDEGITFRLPESSHTINHRSIRRHPCANIQVQLIQNGAVFAGSLIDFSSTAFKAELVTTPPQTLQWINGDLPVNILFFSHGKLLYSGECMILRQEGNFQKKYLVLAPLHSEIRRFRPRETRSTRHKLLPTPRVCFKHPLIMNICSLEVFDISGSGFSVEENPSKSILVPGLILPEIEFILAGTITVKCTVQIIYKKYVEETETPVTRSGLTILDISSEDHVKILALVQQIKDKKSHVCNKLTSTQLWNFFFDTGFIYPSKYKHLEKNKDELKKTFAKLYDGDIPFARHFVYQDDDQILGHMSMLRFYEKTWLIHHHASKKAEQFNAGLNVLNYLSRSIIDSHSLFSAHMNYLACYYRPDNKFPNRIFGGVAQYINDRTACSVDTFAYYKYRRAISHEWGIGGARWTLAKINADELKEFGYFYDKDSGGLLIPAFDFNQPPATKEPISCTFEEFGLRRERHIYSVKKDDSIKAVVVVTLSDLGLNLSNLTNCLQVFVTDPLGFNREVLQTMLMIVSGRHGVAEIPVLLYPVSYAEQNDISYEKLYNLFIIDTSYYDPYFKFLKDFFRFSNRK